MISSDPGAFVSAGNGAEIGTSSSGPAIGPGDDLPATIAPARGDSIGSSAPPAPDVGFAMLLISATGLGPGPQPALGARGSAATPAEATLASVLSGAGVAGNSALHAPENLRALVALSQQSVAVLLATPQSAAKITLIALAGLLRAALAPDGPQNDAAIGALRGFFSQHSADALLALLAPPAQTAAPAVPAIGVPVMVAAQSARSEDAQASKSDREVGRDSRGRRASLAEQRLAVLAIDPRHGLAPEGVAAYEAEHQEELRLQRCPSGEHDFVDDAGAPWDVVAPSTSLGLEATLRAFLYSANVIVALTKLPPGEWHGSMALLRRLSAAPGARRLVALGTNA